ncbi:MAG: hypothetical protein HOW73_27740 [Polyangiaceae bacterium]|nr:hypothetical protein [Polyangiaceae bacterium]
MSTPANAGLVEASGLAASSVHEGAFYAHNDSGDTARFFAFGADGSDLGTYDVAGANAIDWEDMSRGPCADPKKSCLYFGDIGDNDTERKTYVVYRVEEPATLGPGTFTVQSEAFTFRYPDGSHNAEALLVHPTTGVVYIVTKSASAAKIFAFPTPLDSKKTATLVELGEATVPDLIPLVTGGDIHPSGTGVLLRTYTSIWLYPIARGGTVEAALAAKPCSLPTSVERQGETVAWTPSGDGYRSISEGSRQTVHGVTCGHN